MITLPTPVEKREELEAKGWRLVEASPEYGEQWRKDYIYVELCADGQAQIYTTFSHAGDRIPLSPALDFAAVLGVGGIELVQDAANSSQLLRRIMRLMETMAGELELVHVSKRGDSSSRLGNVVANLQCSAFEIREHLTMIREEAEWAALEERANVFAANLWPITSTLKEPSK